MQGRALLVSDLAPLDRLVWNVRRELRAQGHNGTSTSDHITDVLPDRTALQLRSLGHGLSAIKRKPIEASFLLR